MGQLRSLAWAATSALLAGTASAQTPAPDMLREANATQLLEQQPVVQPVQPEAPPAAEQLVRHDLIEPILANISSRSLASTDEAEKAWLTQLSTYYASAGVAPLWVYRDGLLSRGWEAIHMLRGADDYGLNPQAFQIPEVTSKTPSNDELASAEVQLSLSVARYAWHAAGGRLDPKQVSMWLDQPTPRFVDAADVLRAVAERGDATGAMRNFHPKNPQFELLRQAYITERGDIAVPTASIVIPNGPVLKRGDRNADVALVRKRLQAPSASGDETLVDRQLLSEVRAFMYEQGYGRKRVIDNEVRAALSKAVTPRSKGNKQALLEKYKVNMERWRWLPAEFGQLHIWNNLPEFETRVVKNGTTIHEERIVIGTTKTQTPVFSDQMSRIIFQPDWGVPYSIKIRDLMPRLRGGDTSVLTRRNMMIHDGTREIKASKFNWSKVDARNVPIVQRPGPGNPLGQLKFIFPNAHDVYMHDTPSKSLFNSKERTFSHGCIRVRNPQRLAEVLLGETEGWTPDDVKRQLKNTNMHRVDLKQPVPVHNTYFTLVADAQGNVQQLKDVYNYDRRIQDALNGTKSLQQIAAADPALALKRENEELKKRVYVAKPVVPRVKRVIVRSNDEYEGGWSWFD